jgi:hypothetical protein
MKEITFLKKTKKKNCVESKLGGWQIMVKRRRRRRQPKFQLFGNNNR